MRPTGTMGTGHWLALIALLGVEGSCNARSLEASSPPARATSAPLTSTGPASNPSASPAPADGKTVDAESFIPASGGFVLAGRLSQGGWVRGRAPQGADRVTLDGAPVILAADGAFLVAFDRDAQSSALLVASKAGRELGRTALTVAPRGWRIERIDADPRPSSIPAPDYARIRAAELGRINAARAIRPVSEGWRQRFIWPAQGRVSGLFGSQRIYRGTPGAYHSGLDIAGAAGTPFVAPADGVVILAAQSPFTLEGNLLMIDHGMGLSSAFLHCSALLVQEGDVVRQGQVIGRIGMTGRATGPHLHWGIKWEAARLDPLLFLPSR